MRRATGEALAASPLAGAAVVGAELPPFWAWVAVDVAGAAGSAAAEPGLMRPMTCPTVTVSPSWARISVIVPAAGAGSSMSTLSVEISTTVSPSLTSSPTLTDHSSTVPSVTDSPPVGVTMSIIWPAADSTAARPSASVVAPAAASSTVTGGDSPETGGACAGRTPLPSAGSDGAPSVEISASSAPTAIVSPSAT